MEINEDAVDDAVLALLYLTTFKSGSLNRAWKNYDWDVLNRLYEAGFIGNPVGKSKSVMLTPEGERRSAELFERLFAGKS